MKKYLELIFPDRVRPGDVEIIAAATTDRPGQARLGAARIEPASDAGSRVLSGNGRGLIGIIPSDQPAPPYDSTYWLEEDKNGA